MKNGSRIAIVALVFLAGSGRLTLAAKAPPAPAANVAPPPRSLAEMIEAGDFDYEARQITEKNFPVDPARYRAKDRKVFSFRKPMKTSEVEAAMRSEGYEPARIEALLAYGAEHPADQELSPIIGLGSSWKDEDEVVQFPCLSGHGGERGLALVIGGVTVAWSDNDRFLGERRSGN